MSLGVAILLAAMPPLAASPADRQLADRQLADPAAEARASALMAELRCLVCEGQSIADSDAAMAGTMRGLVRERIARGERPEEVRAWLVARYGEQISYRPSLTARTWPLWAAPLLILAAGLWLARRRFRRR